MQLFEILLILISACVVLFYQVLPQNRNPVVGVSLLSLLLVLHLLWEGYRWQMLPAYLLFFLAILLILRKRKPRFSIFLKVLGYLASLIILGLSACLPLLFPVFKLPPTLGPYQVGTQDLWLKSDRDEVISADNSETRNFMIKVWYPSPETGPVEDRYGDYGGRSGFAQKYGLPPAMLNYLDKVKTKVYRDVPLVDEKFPVLIFSHGYHSKANGYYALLSELASQGYVVLAINHTYESTGSTFPDGSVKYFDMDYARKIEAGSWEKIQAAIESFNQDLSFEKRHTVVSEALRSYFVRDMIERWALDILDIVDKLEDYKQTGFLAGKLDLSKIGVIGHSRGGGAAGEALLRDARLKAGVNLDGVQWGQIVDTSFQQPFLFISSDWPPEHENLNQHAYIHKSQAVFYKALIRESGHSNFMDIPFMIPVRALNQAGSIDPEEAIAITRELVLAFFDKHLKGQNTDPLSLGSTYERLEIKK